MKNENKLTWSKSDGTWGLKNYDIQNVPKELYGAICKLHDYPNHTYQKEKRYEGRTDRVSTISRQIKELKNLSEKYTGVHRYVRDELRKAADTMESLFERLRIAEKFNYDAFNIIGKMVEEIENCYGRETELTERARECLDRMGYGGWWISCEDRLPKDHVEVLVWFEYFRFGTYNRLFQTIGISYMYNGKWSGFVNGESGWKQLRIIAWQPLPEPYMPERRK